MCPSLGFFEFLKKDYLDQIFSWQMPSGCFGVSSEKDSALQDQVPQKLPPKMDLAKLGISDKLKNLSKISSLDFRKQQMQQQLKNLKSSNQLLQSMLQARDSEGVHVNKFHQQLQLPVKHQDFGDTNAQGAEHLDNGDLPQNQNLLDNHFRNVDMPNRPQGKMLNRAQVEEANIPNRLQGNQARVQGNLPNILQGVDAFAAQRMARNRNAAPVQNADSADQVPMFQVQGVGQHLQHPVAQDILGNRLPGHKPPSAYETGQGTKRKLLVEQEMPGEKRNSKI